MVADLAEAEEDFEEVAVCVWGFVVASDVAEEAFGFGLEGIVFFAFGGVEVDAVDVFC